jgi:hypothetical protein
MEDPDGKSRGAIQPCFTSTVALFRKFIYNGDQLHQHSKTTMEFVNYEFWERVLVHPFTDFFCTFREE